MEKTEKDKCGIQQLLLKRLRREPQVQTSLRMTPMIDMIFLLLIFFLLTANFRPKENFLPLKLPAAQAQSSEPIIVEPLTIYILAAPGGCEVRIGRIQMVRLTNEDVEGNLSGLIQAISNIMQRQKRHPGDPVEIVCDADVKWQYLARVYNVLFGMGLTDITFLMTN